MRSRREDSLAQGRTQTATSLIAVYKALGGGWMPPCTPPSEPSPPCNNRRYLHSGIPQRGQRDDSLAFAASMAVFTSASPPAAAARPSGPGLQPQLPAPALGVIEVLVFLVLDFVVGA